MTASPAPTIPAGSADRELVRTGETFPDALARALSGSGRRWRTGRGSYGPTDAFTIFAVAITPTPATIPATIPASSASTAPDEPWAMLTYHDNAESTWLDPAPVMETQHVAAGHPLTDEVRARLADATIQQRWREDFVRKNLAALTTVPTLNGTGVTTPLRELTREAVTGLMRAQQALMLAVWWEDRMTQGHTHDSARTLLALTAHPALAHRIIHDPTTGAPTIHRLH